jgi:hypothetical protein
MTSHATTCTRCSEPLDRAAVMCDAQVCTDCVRRSLAPTEWAVFLKALRTSVDDRGLISQTRVRPLIQSIPPKHRGQLYRRAMSEGLIRPDGYEPSTDLKGRNTDKPQRTYRWVAAERKAS